VVGGAVVEVGRSDAHAWVEIENIKNMPREQLRTINQLYEYSIFILRP
jgi:hypothetical protein